MDNGASSYRRFLAGDDKGIEEIVIAYKDGLILYLNGFVNNIHTAEDLAEDTFFKLLVKKPRFSGKSLFKSWLYAIGRNLTIDWIRHSSRMLALPAEDMAILSAEESSLEQAYISETRKLVLHCALKSLPTDYRQVIWLVYFEEMSNDEAARAMKKNSKQIRNLLYRGKQALKNELEKEGFVYEEL